MTYLIDSYSQKLCILRIYLYSGEVYLLDGTSKKLLMIFSRSQMELIHVPIFLRFTLINGRM